MADAMSLTKAGKLQEATALIQSLLGKNEASAMIADGVIDGEFARLDDTPAAKPHAKPHAKPQANPKTAQKTARTGLSETLRKIAAGGMPGPTPLAGKTVAVSEGAQFLALTYSSAQGRRDYRLYVPANHTEAPMPLILMLHGCTQSPEDFALGTGMNDLAEEFGCLVAYPAQPIGANAQKCWNWFRAEDQAANRGEPALLAGLVRQVLRDQNGDVNRVYVAGLSAGGAAAAIVAAAYPDLFQAVGVHSGLAVGAAQDVVSAFSAMRSGAAGKRQSRSSPTIAFHGTADTTVHPGNCDAVVSQALASQPGLRSTTSKGTAAGGRSYTTVSHLAPDGRSIVEHWQIAGAGHAWAGGKLQGSYTDPAGPDASREMLRFFLQHRKPRAEQTS